MAEKTPYERGTSSGDPRFLSPQYIVRCPDCDLNGFLKADGRRDMHKKYLIDRCSMCGGKGKLHLLTRDRIRENPDMARHLGEPGWVFVSRKETLDQYMLDVPRAAGATTTSERPQNGSSGHAAAREGDSLPGG